ncbi:putative inorganic phosphate cotransporter [Rhynchophorus ferrugineus]|uniref:putative inorganic phosphate cotransporter n=1 Tax=Rhynchophorus ferrugineus TaxID=354439 RepID=UPI003FCDD52C
MLHLALQNCYNLRVVLNVAIVEMVEPPESTNISESACPQYETVNIVREGGKFPWPRNTEALVLYAFFFGYILSHVPGGWLADKYGGRYVLGMSVFASALVTSIFPYFTIKGGHWVAVTLRALLGLAQGPILPTVSSFVSTWVPSFERTLLGGIAYGGTNLGTILGSIFTGIIIEASDSWKMAFYVWSSLACVYIILHLFFVFSFPSTHPFLPEEELEYLKKHIVVKRSLKTPWKAILSNVPYWANIAGQFGHNYIFFTLVTYLPTYMKEILQFEISKNGLYSAVPFIALWSCSIILSITGNYIVNSMKFMSPLAFSRFFGTFSNLGAAGFSLAAVYVGCSRGWAIGLYVAGMCIKAFYYMTLPTNINELSKNYGGIMFGICNGISALSGIFGNALVGALTKNKRLGEWKIVFWINFGVAVVTSIIYILWSSSERQPFDYEEEENPQ